MIEQGRLEEAQRVIDLIKTQEIVDFVRGGRPELLSIDSRAPMTRTERKTIAAIDTLLRTPFAASRDIDSLLATAKTRALTTMRSSAWSGSRPSATAPIPRSRNR